MDVSAAARYYARADQRKFVAPAPYDMELIPNYITRLAEAFEEWVNEHYPAKDLDS